MKIICDENLAYPVEWFSQFGEVHLINGRDITNSTLKNANALIIRSITQVNKNLLERTNIKFVGTATIGTDHIDIGYLKSRGIAFASSPGCNSYAVAEYVIASLLFLANKYRFSLKDKSIGIIGIGNVGSKVARFCEALGMTVLKNDPPLYREGKLSESVPLSKILQTDIISLHVPLTTSGSDRTYHLLDSSELSGLKENTVVVNTSRGAVINNSALLDAIVLKKLKVVLDVWENEPCINKKLFNKVCIGTPHIAGYTLEGRVNGTLMVYKAFADFLKKEKSVKLDLPAIEKCELPFTSFQNPEDSLYYLIKNIYDVEKDHINLSEIDSLVNDEVGKYFDKLRKNYPLRREFNNYSVQLKTHTKVIERILKELRFKITR